MCRYNNPSFYELPLVGFWPWQPNNSWPEDSARAKFSRRRRCLAPGSARCLHITKLPVSFFMKEEVAGISPRRAFSFYRPDTTSQEV